MTDLEPSGLGGLPRIALAQMAVCPGRPDLNVARMLSLIAQARARGAELVVFSEMCVPGYILGDAWEIDRLVEDYAGWSETVREASAEITVVFGNVLLDPPRIGEDGRIRKYNAVRVCRDRRWVQRSGAPASLPDGAHPKTLHPNYRFFDDDRHFYSLRKLAAASGRSVYDWMVPFEVPRRGGGTFRFGVQLCEDIWCEDYEHHGEVLDTVRAYHCNGAQAVLNLSASPWTWQKGDKRNRTIRTVLARSPLPFLYVNHVGAQNNGKNIIVFDGDTSAYEPGGTLAARAAPWIESLLLVPGTDPPPAELPAGEAAELAAIHRGIVTGLAHLDDVRGAESRFLIGASGGVDSSVVTCLLADAFGPERVYAVNMPSRFNAALTRENARHLARALGIDYLTFPIQALHDTLSAELRVAEFPRSRGAYTGLVDENLQARIRGSDVLAGLSAKHGLVYTNNGNKTEIALGYATLYGDVNGAIAPIADLYKTQVFALARHLNEVVLGREAIPANLYDGSTVPSAELSAEQDITKGLGDPIRYGYHDAVLRQLIEYRRHPVDLLEWFLAGDLLERIEWRAPAGLATHFAGPAEWLADLEWVERAMRVNYFKRIQAPPIIVLSKRAFGFDLRESQLPAYQPRRYRALRDEVLAAPMPRR